MPKPSDILLGLFNFLAILIPGAVAIISLAHVPSTWRGYLPNSPSDDHLITWATFLVVAYFLGQIMFLCGTLADQIYHQLRRRLPLVQSEAAYQAALCIRDLFLSAKERDAVNPYQWSRAVLMKVSPQAADDINKHEADQKFFRTLVVVGLACGIAYAISGDLRRALLGVGFSSLCFVGYFYWRLKSTTRAYIQAVTLHGLGHLKTDASIDA